MVKQPMDGQHRVDVRGKRLTSLSWLFGIIVVTVASLFKQAGILHRATNEYTITTDISSLTTETGTAAEEEADTVFKRHKKVVIGTKIHGNSQWKFTMQSMCLFHFAYNHKLHYDIVLFTTLDDIPKESIEAFETMIAPAKLTIVKDNMGFQEEVAALSRAKYDLFLERCNVTDPSTLDWQSKCADPGGKKVPTTLAYNWQAEFRGFRIWENPALENYKYMMWLDSDAFPTREWKKDPMDYFIKHKGVIMFDHFPAGSSKNSSQLVRDSFNATVCSLRLNETGGALTTSTNKQQCRNSGVAHIHGFMHITDLDFYRQPKVLHGLKAMRGDCFLCRAPDDQLAVTLPAAIYAPDKAWDMRLRGFDLRIYHNGMMDGQDKLKPAGFRKHWALNSSQGFPTADKVCKITEAM